MSSIPFFLHTTTYGVVLVPVAALPLEEPAMILHDGVSACAIGMQPVVLLLVAVRAPSRNAHASANLTLYILRLLDPVSVYGPLRRVLRRAL